MSTAHHYWRTHGWSSWKKKKCLQGRKMMILDDRARWKRTFTYQVQGPSSPAKYFILLLLLSIMRMYIKYHNFYNINFSFKTLLWFWSSIVEQNKLRFPPPPPIYIIVCKRNQKLKLSFEEEKALKWREGWSQVMEQ